MSNCDPTTNPPPFQTATTPGMPVRRKKFDDHVVGILALITMHNVLLFLILQVPVMIVLTVILVLLPGLGVISEDTAAYLMAVVGILAEVTLLVVLIQLSRAAFRASQQQPEADIAAAHNTDSPPPPPFREIHLEMAFGIAAAVALSWCFVIGLESPSFRIALIVIEEFALLFLLIFMTVRLVATGKVRPLALATLTLTALSLWSLLK